MTTEGRLAPQVWNVALARLVSSVGAEAAFFIGMWGKAAYVFQGTPGDLAVMSASIGVAAIVGSVIGGALVDRFDARRVVLAAEVLVVPSSLALILARDMRSLILIGVVSWAAGSALETAITSLPPVLVPGEQLEQANARLEGANWLALVIGPGAGALLSQAFGLDSVFVLDALTSLAAIAMIVRLQLDPRLASDAQRQPTGSGFAEIVDGLRYAWRTPPVRLALYLEGLVGVAFGVFVALEPLYFRDVLGTEVETIGYVNVVFGVGLFGGSVLLERSKGRFTGFGANIGLSVFAGVGAMLYSGTSSLTWVVVGAAVWSVPLGMSLPMSRTLAQRGCEPAYVGRVMGAFGMVSAGAGILPVVFAPAFANAIGVQRVLVASGAAAILLAPLALPAGRRLDDIARPNARPELLTRRRSRWAFRRR